MLVVALGSAADDLADCVNPDVVRTTSRPDSDKFPQPICGVAMRTTAQVEAQTSSRIVVRTARLGRSPTSIPRVQPLQFSDGCPNVHDSLQQAVEQAPKS